MIFFILFCLPRQNQPMNLQCAAPWIAGVLPIAVFGGGYVWPVSRRQRLIGQPPGAVFGAAWTAIGVAAVLHAHLAARTYQYSALQVLLATTVLSACVCIGWLKYDYSGQDSVSIPLLALLQALSIVSFGVAASSGSLLGTTYAAIPLAWSSYALLMNMVGANV